MKLVIDIQDNVYEGIKKLILSDENIVAVVNAFRKGTPLPKGHGRLIDADKLYNDYVREPEEFKGGRSLMNLFREAPTIIEADTESEDKE